MDTQPKHRTVVQLERAAEDIANRTPQQTAELMRAAANYIQALFETNARLKALINAPYNADFIQGVQIEAAHQVQRWSASHDEGKQPEDWFWLIGYLAGKALRAAKDGDRDKTLHHQISTAAAMLNWRRAITGESTEMRPGIALPQGETP